MANDFREMTRSLNILRLQIGKVTIAWSAKLVLKSHLPKCFVEALVKCQTFVLIENGARTQLLRQQNSTTVCAKITGSFVSFPTWKWKFGQSHLNIKAGSQSLAIVQSDAHLHEFQLKKDMKNLMEIHKKNFLFSNEDCES